MWDKVGGAQGNKSQPTSVWTTNPIYDGEIFCWILMYKFRNLFMFLNCYFRLITSLSWIEKPFSVKLAHIVYIKNKFAQI